jgi:hypothetical protein
MHGPVPAARAAGLQGSCSFEAAFTPASVQAARNGRWDLNDRTGLAPVDTVLDMIAAKVRQNAAAVAALEATAAHVKVNLRDYADSRCNLREAALRARLSQDLAGAGSPSLQDLWPPPNRSRR